MDYGAILFAYAAALKPMDAVDHSATWFITLDNYHTHACVQLFLVKEFPCYELVYEICSQVLFAKVILIWLRSPE